MPSVSGLWNNARLYFLTEDKGAWVFAMSIVLIGALVAVFGSFSYSASLRQFDKRELSCLALNVYFEARGESVAGQQAVAEVTMNRVASRHYPATVCDVVYEKNRDIIRKRYVSAFSWTEIEPRPAPGGKAWRRAQQVATAAYHGRHEPQVDGATLYHAVHIRPSWSRGNKPVARIGRHVFYKEGRTRRRSGKQAG